MLQAPALDSLLSSYAFALLENGFRAAEIGVGRRHMAEAVGVAAMILMLAESLDLRFEVNFLPECPKTATGKIQWFQSRSFELSWYPRFSTIRLSQNLTHVANADKI
jgi:hypothetical protein